MKTNFYTAILLSFIMALASCSKYVVEPDTNFTDRSITIKEAQDYYKPKITNASSARQLVAEGSIQKLENSPNWKRAIEKNPWRTTGSYRSASIQRLHCIKVLRQ